MRAKSRAWINSTSRRVAELSAQAMDVRPGNILVAVRDPRNLYYLQRVLAKTDTTKTDVVVMTSRIYHREHSFSGVEEMDTSEVFKKYEQELFTSVVTVAEKLGKHVALLVVPTNDIFDSIVATAQRLHASVMVCGRSNKLTADEQGKLTGDAWERLPEPRPRLRLVVFEPDGTKHEYMLGPHTPRMRQEDVDLLHGLWKEVTSDPQLPRAAPLPRPECGAQGNDVAHSRRRRTAPGRDAGHLRRDAAQERRSHPGG